MNLQLPPRLAAIFILVSIAVPISSSAQEVLWGMTKTGGANDLGVAYRISNTGSGFAAYAPFNGTNGSSPGDGAGFTQVPYGTAMIGITELGCGGACFGRAFSADLSSGPLSVISDVTFYGAEGNHPTGKVTLGSGNSYCILNSMGGDQGYGTVAYFKFELIGSQHVPGYVLGKLASFNGTNGKSPKGSLVLGSWGNMYGMTESGGVNNKGVIFQYRSGAITKIFDFDGAANGASPTGSLVVADDGKLYGMTVAGGANDLGVIFSINQDGTGFTKLYDFESVASGGRPKGSLVQFTDGKLYGMTSAGGASDFGTIFSITGQGAFMKVIDFDGTNGKSPVGDLVVSPSGVDMYGTAYAGGVNDKGTFFKLTNGGAFQKLYDFTSQGSNPVGSLMMKRQNQTISLDPVPTKYKNSPPFPLVVKTSSGLPALFSLSYPTIDITNEIATINLAKVTVDAFSVSNWISTYQPGNYKYMPAYESGGASGSTPTVEILMLPVPQTITVEPIPDRKFGDASFAPKASSSSSLPVTISAISNVSISSGTVTVTSAGLASLKFSQAGNNLYQGATDVVVTFGVQKADQTIEFNPPTTKVCCDSFSLSSSAKTSVSYSSESPDVGQVYTNSVLVKRAGTLKLTAHAVETSNYRGATITKETAIQAIPKVKPVLTVTSTNVTAKFKDFGMSLVRSSYTGTSIISKSSTPGIAEADQYGNLNFIGIGTTTITITQPATDKSEAAEPVTVNVTVGGLSTPASGNVIAWNSQATDFYLSQGPFNLIATATSGLPVTFTSSDRSVVDIDGNQVILKGAGTATITASQPGERSIVAANPITRTYTVRKISQNISWPSASFINANTLPFIFPVNTDQGLPITYTSSTPGIADVKNSQLLVYKDGRLTITATQSGNAVYASISSTISYDVVFSDPAIYFERIQAKTFGDAPFNLKANAAINIPVTFTSSNPSVISISENTATIVGGGTAKITASTTAQGAYRAGILDQTVVVAKKSQTISFSVIEDMNFADPNFIANATATSGLPVVYKTTTPGTLKVSSNFVEISGSGSATLIAMQSGNDNYLKADSIVRTFQVRDSGKKFSLFMSSAGGTPAGGGSVFTVDSDGGNMQIVKGFEAPAKIGLTGGFVKDASGNFYMNSSLGGTTNTGTIVSIDADGNNFRTLASYELGVTGGSPAGSPIIGSDGYLYATLTNTLPTAGGSIVRAKLDGTEMTKIHNFITVEGYRPSASLLQASDGRLYGMTDLGGISGAGVIYSVETNGDDFKVLRNLASNNNTSYYVQSRVLLEGNDGKIYGSTFRGGSTDNGTIFNMNKDGSGFQILVDFDIATSGQLPGEIMIASNGKIYGMLIDVTGVSYIYSVNVDGSQFTKLVAMPGTGLSLMNSPITEGSDGTLYGTFGLGGASNAGIIFKINKDGSGFQSIHDFDVAINSFSTRGSLIESSSGVFYGATSAGGPNGLGGIFKITATGDYTLVKSFMSTESMNSGIGFDQPGNNYVGISTNSVGSISSFFRMNPAYQKFYTWPSNRHIDGSPLVVSNGYIWTYVNQDGGSQYIVRTKTDGTESADIFSNSNQAQTGASVKAWIESDGYVYGLMDVGGANGKGTFFRINIDGTGFTKLTDLPSNRPVFPVILRLSSDGNFYAMAATASVPTFFTLTKGGAYHVIKTFLDSESGLVRDMLELPNGEFAVLNTYNGSSTTISPSIFTISKNGIKTGVIYNSISELGNTSASFMKSMDGWLYVLTSSNGVTGDGEVFKIRTDGSSYKKIIDNDRGKGFMVNSMFFSKEAQILSLMAISDKKSSEGPFAPVYTSSSGVKPVLTSSDLSVATIENGFVKLVGAGTVKISAVIPENSNYYQSNTATQEFKVTRDVQSISFTSPGVKSFDDGAFLMKATATSGLPVTYTVTKGHITISDNVASIVQPGAVIIQASQPGNAAWIAADPVSVSFCINPPIPKIMMSQVGAMVTLSIGTQPGIWNASNQWYRDKIALPNGTALITASESGTYTVTTTVEECKSDSAPVAVVVTGVNEETKNSIEVYPNPVSNELNIAGISKDRPKDLKLMNYAGQIFEAKTRENNDAIIMDVADLPSGVYVLRMMFEGAVIYKKILKER